MARKTSHGLTDLSSRPERPKPLVGTAALEWLVKFATLDVGALVHGAPGDLPNVLYDLKRWLDLEPGEPLNNKVDLLQKNPSKLSALVRRVAGLLNAITERREFSATYRAGRVYLHADRFAEEGARALSYRDADLPDAVIRVALDDVCEDLQKALNIRRCREQNCAKLFFAHHAAQSYCGHRCATNAATRAYRERHRSRSSRLENSRDRSKPLN